MITDIITIYQWALRLSAVTLVLPFLAVMFWRKVTKRAVFISMLSSGIITTIWPLLGTGWNQTIVGFLISLVTLVGISLMTEHSETEKVKAVYFEDFDRSKTTYQESPTYHA
ncbi:hypothetical protein [Pontibacillus yanchengensis]|uniref:Uncharacterized protein n=1 Tax=Pontibacillus yanchengensis Y32 TaxID=1385514 RepID=A0A0A2TJP8_9BACI|nr:hypothetical protein [Pontibacillus yanchengensis]KGP74668.1 hypothetical protein N782_00235 [Pontibacillus yanchengensis Y32]